jgi:hypothetical protein
MRALSCVRVGLVAVLLSCSGTEPQPESGPPASLEVLAGGEQEGVVGEELPDAVVVRVTDAQGEAVSGLLLNFVVTKGGGSVFAGSAQTNTSGEARERWTLGPAAGEQILEARAVDQTTGDPIVFGQITATAVHGPVAAFSLSTGVLKLFRGERLDLATLVYAAVDEFGNAVPDPPLTLEVSPPFTKEGTTLWSDTETKGPAKLMSGTAINAVEVTVVRDLSELVGATGSYACDGIRYNIEEGNTTRLAGSFVVDSVAYPAVLEGFSLGESTLWITRYDTRTLDDGSTRVTGPTTEGLVVLRQEPELLVVRRWSHTTWVSDIGEAAQTSADPLSYRGGNMCNSNYWSRLDSFEPLTITR